MRYNPSKKAKAPSFNNKIIWAKEITMEINVHDLKEAIEEAKKNVLESNKNWMTIREQNIAEVTIKNFMIELFENLLIND